MAITECPQGHLYDPALYSACPYCAGGGTMIDFSARQNRTAAPSGYGGGTPNATAAPAGYGNAQENHTVAPMGYGGGQYGQAPASADYAPPPVNRTVPVGNAASAGKTVAPEGYRKRQAEENKTVGTFRKTLGDIEPVVGWLACCAGPDKGKSYELFAKINTIGRSSENDVCIKNDATVSRKNHARLAYDPRHNDFRLIPDESMNNIYLNDEPVYTPARLSPYDRVELGESKFVFVPLCGEHFRWEQGG